MTYQPYLIANYSTGVDTRLQPWLIPDDAQEELFDGFVYRGVMSKRQGYNYLATGTKGGAPYRESRIVHTYQGEITSDMEGVIDSANMVFTLTGHFPIIPLSVVVTGSTPLQTLTDDGAGNLSGDGTGTVDYNTGDISVTFTSAPTAGTVSVTYINGTVMAETPDGINQIFTLTDKTQLARGSVTIAGNDPVQSFTDNGLGEFYDGITPIGTVDYITGDISITLPIAPVAMSLVYAAFDYMPGNPVMMIANFINETNVKQLIVADTQYVNKYNTVTNVLEDISPVSPYTGTKFDFFSWVNYPDASSVPRLLFSNNKDVIQQYTESGGVVNYAPTLTGSPTLTCAFMFVFKDRLILARPTVAGTIYPQRLMISGTGANCDVFDTTATGAGFIDIPDGSWIFGGSANRDDFLIFTQDSTWVLKYTGNDTVPFVIDRIDESRGSDATFATITYLNRTSAVSKRGLIITDGYRVERQDELIPDFSFNQIDQENFALCFAGVVDEDRDHYLLYPPSSREHSLRILTTNYDEDNYCTYRIPLSCMGRYQESFNITWDDLTIYPNWASLGADFGNWYAFAYNKGSPFSVGGGHKGEIWRLNVNESEDNPVRIYDITVVDSTTIEVTTDFNNYRLNIFNSTLFDYEYADESQSADYIFFTGISGMQEINNQQFPIISVTSNNVFRVDVSSAGNANNFTAYTSGGRAERVIPFSSTFKKFNPFAMQDKKVRCGWLYMYVDSAGTKLKRNFAIQNITQANPCVITTFLDHGLSTGEQVLLFGIGGMTELNDTTPFITVIDENSFSLDGVDSSLYTPFTSEGYVSKSLPAKLDIDIITNDNGGKTQLNIAQEPYQGNMTNLTFENGSKKWYKVFINQTGRFIQFRLRNTQAGAAVNIQATMPGFQSVGRLI